MFKVSCFYHKVHNFLLCCSTNSTSTETSNCDPSSAETDDHDGKQTGSLEGYYGHGSTEISDCRYSSVEIDDHDNAEMLIMVVQ